MGEFCIFQRLRGFFRQGKKITTFLDFSTISKQQQEACTYFHGGVSHAILYSQSERFQVFSTVTPLLSKCHYNIKTAVCPCFLLLSSFSINARMDSSEKPLFISFQSVSVICMRASWDRSCSADFCSCLDFIELKNQCVSQACQCTFFKYRCRAILTTLWNSCSTNESREWHSTKLSTLNSQKQWDQRHALESLLSLDYSPNGLNP